MRPLMILCGLALLAGCNDPLGPGSLLQGQWGGDRIAIDARPTGTIVILPCIKGLAANGFQFDEQGVARQGVVFVNYWSTSVMYLTLRFVGPHRILATIGTESFDHALNTVELRRGSPGDFSTTVCPA